MKIVEFIFLGGTPLFRRERMQTLEGSRTMFSVGKIMKIRLFMIVGLFLLTFAGAPRHASADDGGIFFMVNPANLLPCNQVYSQTEFNPWYKDILKTVEKSAMSVGGGIYGKLVGGTKRFMAVLLGLWIALLAMKQVGSMTETDGLEFGTKIGGICIKAAIIFILINQGTFTEFIWNPIVNDVPNEIGNPAAGGAEKALGKAIKAGEATRCLSHIWGFDISIGKWPSNETDPGIFDPGIQVHGCFPIFFAFLLSIAIPIFLCDLYLRKGIVFAFCPLFVGAFLFPATKDFGRKGINAALNIIFFQIVLYILLEIAGSILINSAGLASVSASMDEGKIKNIVCSLRLFGSSDSEECQGATAYAGNNLIVMVVMGVYCIYMLTLADKFAENFSDASFGETGAAALGAVKKTGAAMEKGAGMAKSAAGATGRFAGKAMDRMAARTVEKARSGGTPGGFRAGLASFYLKQRGILNKDGSETKAYGAALANGTRRSIANFVSGGRLYKNEAYQNWAKNGPRDNAAAAADASYQDRLGNKPKPASGSGSTPKKTPDQLNKEKAKSSQTLADAQKYMSQNTDYSKMPNGQNQKSYDRMRAANTQMQANFDKKVAADPNYANSAQGKAEQKKIQDDRAKVDAFAQKNNVNTMAMDRCEARVRGSMDPNMNSHAKASDKLNRVADAQRNAIANTSYPNTAAGNMQKSYDTQRAAQSQAWADHQAKIASDPSYKGSDQWRQDRQQLRAQDDNLQKMAKDNNLDTSKMDKAESSTLDNDKMMKRAMIHARITGGIRDRVDAVTSTVSNTWDSAKNTARDARDAVKAVPTNIRNGLNSAANKVSDTWNSAKDSVKDARDSVADSVNRKANRVADTFDSVKDKFSGTIGRIKNK